MIGKIDITQLDRTVQYHGYLWFSDARKPLLLNGEVLPDDFPGQHQNPFIAEGHLISADKKVSYQLRHNGAETQVYAYPWQEMLKDSDQYLVDAPQAYLLKGGEKGRKVLFRTVWKAEANDSSQPEFKVLTPLFKAFYGFETEV